MTDAGSASREPRWGFVGPANRVLTCAMVRVATGFEVQVAYEPSTDPLRTKLQRTLKDARIVAAQWREVVAAKGGFIALDLPSTEPGGGSRPRPS